MIEIPLARGKVTLIDDFDSDLAEVSWYYGNKGYVRRRQRGKRKSLFLHRVILARIVGRPLEHHEETDHRNRNSLDNRRANLRIATRKQNNQNRGLQRNNRSGYMGVSRKRNYVSRPWQAHINIEGKRCHLGYFATPEQAARIYNQAAQLYHGEYATLNVL